MSKFLLTAPVLAIAATATPAGAQDFNWTGFYVGANGAVVDADAEWTGANIYQTVDGAEGSFTTALQTDPIDEKLGNTEFGGGGRLGFNWQSGNFVLGAEADATFFGFTETVTRTAPNATYTLRSHASDLETVRARLGVASGPALIFVTGGAAFSNFKHSLTATDVSEVVIDGGEGSQTIGTLTANLADSAKVDTGWTVGGGGEVQVTENVSVALTLLHIDFGSDSLADSAPPSSISATVKSTMFLGVLGVNLRF